ncbi:MAG: DNA polymerase III subunit delta' [Caldicoprobacterales bacterium]|jgi:DNA polymerase-3 subunit delta'
MNTGTIIGQSPLLYAMERILDRGMIVHAYLFIGPEGSGKKTMSNLFAQALLCTNKGEGKPCRSCITCRQFDSGNHPDVVRVRILEGKTAILVDQIRDMQSVVNIKPYQAGRRICFIEDAHLMNVQAQNALLKTLEEPPSHTVIILLADNINSLLPTILSRCQHFRIGHLSHEEIAQLLNRHYSMDPEEASVYAVLSQGNPGKALTLANDETLHACREELARGIGLAGSVKIADLYGLFMDNKDRTEVLFELMELWIRDLILLKETGDWNLIINKDKSSLLSKQAARFTSKGLQDMIQKIELARTMLKSNTNYQLTIETMLYQF